FTANVFVARRRLDQTEQQRAHPKECPTAYDRGFASRNDVGDPLIGKLGKPTCVDVVGRLEVANQVVRNALQFVGTGLAATDVEVAVNLDAVGAYDLAVECFGQLDGQSGFPRRCGAHHHPQLLDLCQQGINGVQPCAPTRSTG